MITSDPDPEALTELFVIPEDEDFDDDAFQEAPTRPMPLFELPPGEES